jgi:hypothetical protein
MIDVFMLPLGVRQALALLNFVLCTAIGYSCVCRFAIMSAATVAPSWRLRYVVVMVAATTSGLSPWLWGEWPGPGQITMAFACLYVIGLTARGWKAGPPSYASRPMPLDDGDLHRVAGGRGAP